MRARFVRLLGIPELVVRYLLRLRVLNDHVQDGFTCLAALETLLQQLVAVHIDASNHVGLELRTLAQLQLQLRR